ncbi:GatB/YqeY domain-containing protein [Candidatus Berkelbacteria bacterium]|nr:GatB/YqeY domain-containing protein [Candidatus Berkelbacteria bacterium]
MTLIERIDDELKAAMKSADSTKTGTLRLVRAALKNKEIELGHALSDKEVLAVLKKEVKQRREAVEQYTTGGRAELAEKESAEIALLEEYLPAELGDDELVAIVAEAIQTAGASTPADMGKVMGVAMGKVAGRADGNRVSALVRAKLAS